jgi:hypothetical protein
LRKTKRNEPPPGRDPLRGVPAEGGRRAQIQPEGEIGENKKQADESKIAFFCFLSLFLVSGIGTFQWVAAEKSEKNFPRLDSRMRLQAKALKLAHTHVPACAGRKRVDSVQQNYIASISDFCKALFPTDTARPRQATGRSGICRGAAGRFAVSRPRGRSLDNGAQPLHCMGAMTPACPIIRICIISR